MQNAQNTEIQQRVINLVNLYRAKVGKESQTAKELAEEYKSQYDNEIDFAYSLHEQGIEGYVLDIDIPEDAVDAIRANEQLLGHFYKEVAGDDADSIVLDSFLPKKYDKTIFSEEEEHFLKSHFKELVNYIIQTPNNDLSAIEGSDRMDYYLIPSEVLELIKKRVNIPAGSKVYNPFTGFAQFTSLYSDCSYFCEESYISHDKKWNEYCDMCRKSSSVVHTKINEKKLYSWMRVALYANKVDAVLINDGIVPESFDVVVSYIPWIPTAIPDNAYGHWGEEPDDQEIIGKIQLSYQNLPNGGKMILILPKENCWKKKTPFSFEAFWKQIVDDGSLKEVIQLPSIMGKHLYKEYCTVIVEKGGKHETTFIDVRFATKKSDNADILDLDAINTMIQNGGVEPRTGLCKMTTTFSVDSNLIVPQVYVKETPGGKTTPVLLSELCSFESLHIYDVKENLPEDTPWVTAKDLSTTFRGALDIVTLKKAGCPNNPKNWRFGNREIHFLEVAAVGSDVTHMDMHISEYRNCWYLDGSKDAVLFKLTKDGITTALINASGVAIAVSPDIYVLYPESRIEATFYPKSSIDALSLLALINLPLVYRQMEAYQEFGLAAHFRNILVPTEECVIVDGKSVLLNEERAYQEQLEIINAQKTAYINEVRMRKHDMGQKVFDLINTEDLMRYYVENRETESDVWSQIEEQLDHFRSTIHELSEMLDHLSQEEQFGTPELLDLNDYFANLQHSNNVNGFKLSYQLDRESILELQLSRKKDKDIKDISSVKATPTIYMAKNDLERVVSNVLANAQKHGFLDSNRKDYEVNIRLEFNADKGMYQIDFRNNGKPLPDGMNKMRYGIKGEKAGQTAGTGLGGSIVKSIVEHYKGDYNVYMDGDWTVIRVYLPIVI